MRIKDAMQLVAAACRYRVVNVGDWYNVEIDQSKKYKVEFDIDIDGELWPVWLYVTGRTLSSDPENVAGWIAARMDSTA